MSALEIYQAQITAINARIAALETLKTDFQAEVVADVAADLLSDRLREEVGRPFESEINWLRFKKNEASIAFAESNL